MAKVKLPRGIRNNNPLNIRRGKTPWLYEVTLAECPDKSFCQFQTMRTGWRAAFMLLRTYLLKYKLRTIRQIISKWAPSNENNTEMYIRHVSTFANLHPDEIITRGTEIIRIAAGMCIVENGDKYNPLLNTKDISDMDWGYACAFGSKDYKLP